MIVAGTTWPTWYRSSTVVQGSGRARFRLSAIFLVSRSTLSTIHVDFLADAKHLARMIDAIIGELRDVNESVRSTEIDERAEASQVAHDAAADLSGLELIHQFVFALCASVPARPRVPTG